MAVIRWEPARELQSIQQEMNRLFGTFFDSPTGGQPGGAAYARRWIPAMDLVEEAEQFVLRADLPGVREDQLKVELEDSVLTISGERQDEQRDRGEGYSRIERAYGSFSRTLTLPDGIDPDAIDASFEAGVLTVRIPKPEQRKPRRVAISVDGRQSVIEGAEGDGAGDAQSAGAEPAASAVGSSA